ncbi:MAG: hypothetical protein U9R48_11440 [Chloroflexota bacterium]|nr:hypothetical protein [Chloroflexota bacterium]
MSDEQAVYEIRLRGHLDEKWSDWFNGMVITLERDREGTSVTSLRGMVDQAKLRGTLNKIWDLGLTVMTVNTVTPSTGAVQEGN